MVISSHPPWGTRDTESDPISSLVGGRCSKAFSAVRNPPLHHSITDNFPVVQMTTLRETMVLGLDAVVLNNLMQVVMNFGMDELQNKQQIAERRLIKFSVGIGGRDATEALLPPTACRGKETTTANIAKDVTNSTSRE